MANRKQTVQIGGVNTGEVTQTSDEPAEQTLEVEAQEEAVEPEPQDEYTEENRQQDLSQVESLKEVFSDFDKENAPLPPVTRHTAFEPTPQLKALAERFSHLSEAEIAHMASVNSWSSELHLEVIRNTRIESRDVMHPPVATAQEIVLLDNGDNS